MSKCIDIDDNHDEDDDIIIRCDFCRRNPAIMPVSKGWICDECIEDEMAEITNEEEFDDFF